LSLSIFFRSAADSVLYCRHCEGYRHVFGRAWSACFRRMYRHVRSVADARHCSVSDLLRFHFSRAIRRTSTLSVTLSTSFASQCLYLDTYLVSIGFLRNMSSARTANSSQDSTYTMVHVWWLGPVRSDPSPTLFVEPNRISSLWSPSLPPEKKLPSGRPERDGEGGLDPSCGIGGGPRSMDAPSRTDPASLVVPRGGDVPVRMHPIGGSGSPAPDPDDLPLPFPPVRILLGFSYFYFLFFCFLVRHFFSFPSRVGVDDGVDGRLSAGPSEPRRSHHVRDGTRGCRARRPARLLRQAIGHGVLGSHRAPVRRHRGSTRADRQAGRTRRTGVARLLGPSDLREPPRHLLLRRHRGGVAGGRAQPLGPSA